MSDKIYLQYQPGGIERLVFPKAATADSEEIPNSWVWLYQTQTNKRKDINEKKAKIENYALHIILPTQDIEGGENAADDYNDLVSWFKNNKIQTNAIKDTKYQSDKKATLQDAYLKIHQEIEKTLKGSQLKSNDAQIAAAFKKSLPDDLKKDANNLKSMDDIIDFICNKDSDLNSIEKCPEALFLIYVYLKDYQKGYGSDSGIFKAKYGEGQANNKKLIIDALDLFSGGKYAKLVKKIESLFKDKTFKMHGDGQNFAKQFLAFISITQFITDNIDKLEKQGDDVSNLSKVVFTKPLASLLDAVEEPPPSLKGWESKDAAEKSLDYKIRKANTFKNETPESKLERKEIADKEAQAAAEKGGSMDSNYNDIQAFFSLVTIIKNKTSLPGKPLEEKASSFKLISLGKMTREDIASALSDMGDAEAISIYTVSEKTLSVGKDWWDRTGSNIVLSSKGPAFIEKSIDKFSKVFSKKSVLDKISDLNGELNGMDPKELAKKVKNKISNSLYDAYGERDTPQKNVSTDDQNKEKEKKNSDKEDSKEGSDKEGSKEDSKEGSDKEGSEEGSDKEGSKEDSKEGSDKEGSEEGSEEDSKEGSDKEGSEEGSDKEGSEEGSKEGSKEGSDKEGSKEDSKEGSDKEGSDKEGSEEDSKEGSDKEGSEEDSKEGSEEDSKEGSEEDSKEGSKEGSDKEGSEEDSKEGSDKEGSEEGSKEGSDKEGSEEDSKEGSEEGSDKEGSEEGSEDKSNNKKESIKKNKKHLINESVINMLAISQSNFLKKIIAKAMNQTHLSEKMLFTVGNVKHIPANVKSKIKETNSKASIGSSSNIIIGFKNNENTENEIRTKITEYQSKIATMILNNISFSKDSDSFGAQNVLIADMKNKDSNSGIIYFIIIVDKWVD